MIEATATAVTADQAKTLLDHAATQSDRWLFLCVLAILLVCLMVAVVYMAKWVRATISEMRADRADLVTVVRENTQVLHQVRERLLR